MCRITYTARDDVGWAILPDAAYFSRYRTPAKLWGGPLGPRPTPSPACGDRQGIDSTCEERAQGTRPRGHPDQGFNRPTILEVFQGLRKLSRIGQFCP